MSTIPEPILELVKGSQRVVLATHVHPDGDALGSLFGLADSLTGLGKKVFCYLEEPVSHLYDFLPDCGRVETDIQTLKNFVQAGGEENIIAIALDCGDSDRLGKAKEDLLAVSPFIVIDHHFGHTPFGDHLWLEPECSSTGEMVYQLITGLGAKVTEQAAISLYVAISTDTGSFRYENTRPGTFRVAADLVEAGVDPARVAGKVYDNFTLERLRLMEMVLGTLEIYAGGQIGMIRVTSEMFSLSGADRDDVEGFVNYPKALRSVRVAAFLKEGKEGMISVSLRAKGSCDVAAVAASFGGGGHRNAAGFRFSDVSMEEVQKKVLDALRKALG